MAIIEVTDLRVRRNTRIIIDGLNLSIERGTITAVVGPNGCGKSTLIAALAGDLPYERGRITLADQDLRELTLEAQADIRSVVMQDRTYWLSYTVREVIEMGQSSTSISRIDAIAESLDMSSYLHQKVTTLSGGQAQRVEIARALIRDSQIYLLDEPLAAQDADSQRRTIALLKKFRDTGKTIVVIAHTDKSRLDWCDQIIDYWS